MIVKKVKDTAISETPHNVDVRKLYDKDTAQAVHISLQPGETLKPHITPVDVLFYVLEGTPEILIDDEKQTIDADCLVESPKDLPHCISNNSDKLVRILVVKAPKPTAKTILL